ncbi:putative Fe-containing alcohol dehydrogenase [Mycena vulgaris]|nr:putative Fe-containing alcohol dehydrogenase [Mycena vulgaris]
MYKMELFCAEVFRPAVPAYPGPLPKSLVNNALDVFNHHCDISYGLPFSQACAKHAEETFHAQKIYMIASGTLARETSALRDLQAALGAKVVGVKSGLKAHTYFNDAVAIAGECRALDVDLILTLGGGSLSDAAKMVALALSNDVAQSADFLKLPTTRTRGTLPPAKSPTVPVICIATTLSGGEFTLGAGATDERDDKKYQFFTGQAIRLVILDAPFVTATTPPSLFLQSGFRAVDHCMESLCSPYCNEVSDMHARLGLAQLVPGLLRCRAEGDAKADIEARLLCQMASIDSIASFSRVYTPCGGSHAIGHMLGPFGFGHGHTSGILLPAVCKYNARHGGNLAESKGLKEGVADLGDLLDVLVRELGMPRTLAEVGVGRDKLDQLAEYTLLDSWADSNPVPLKEKAQVMEILEMIAG